MRKRYSSSKVEWAYIDQLTNAICNEAIRNQVYNALVWYVIESSRYKFLEYFLNGVTLVSPSLIMLLNECGSQDCKWGPIAVTGIGTFAAAAKSFSKLHEKRVNYRTAAEAIKSETILYIRHAGIYVAVERDTLFVEKIDLIRKEENASWVKLESDKNKGQD